MGHGGAGDALGVVARPLDDLEVRAGVQQRGLDQQRHQRLLAVLELQLGQGAQLQQVGLPLGADDRPELVGPQPGGDQQLEEELVAVAALPGGRQQYEQVKRVPGVEVAAPIANLGYAPLTVTVPVPLNRLVGTGDRRQLYRVSWTWVANGGLSRYPDAQTYVYYTPNPLISRESPDGAVADYELVPGRGARRVCWAGLFVYPEVPRTPYDRAAAPDLLCDSGKDRRQGSSGQLAAVTTARPPVLLAAIDPEQEARLVALDRAVVTGRYLRAGERETPRPPRSETPPGGLGPSATEIPVLLSTRSYVDQALEANVEQVRVPAGVDLPAKIESKDVWRFLRGLPGRRVDRRAVTAEQIQRLVLATYSGSGGSAASTRWLDKYTQPSPVTYAPAPAAWRPSPSQAKSGRPSRTGSSPPASTV
jgi:putative ABC transport system permease protein